MISCRYLNLIIDINQSQGITKMIYVGIQNVFVLEKDVFFIFLIIGNLFMSNSKAFYQKYFLLN